MYFVKNLQMAHVVGGGGGECHGVCVIMTMFTSYHIGFLSVSQNYTILFEHTFPSIFMLSVSVKALNIIFMCFDGKNNHLKKNTRECTAIVVTKKC